MTRGARLLLVALACVLVPLGAYAVGGLGATVQTPTPRQDIVIDDSSPRPTPSRSPGGSPSGPRGGSTGGASGPSDREDPAPPQRERGDVRVVTPVPAPVDDDDDGDDRDDDEDDDGGDDDGDDD